MERARGRIDRPTGLPWPFCACQDIHDGVPVQCVSVPMEAQRGTGVIAV